MSSGEHCVPNVQQAQPNVHHVSHYCQHGQPVCKEQLEQEGMGARRPRPSGGGNGGGAPTYAVHLILHAFVTHADAADRAQGSHAAPAPRWRAGKQGPAACACSNAAQHSTVRHQEIESLCGAAGGSAPPCWMLRVPPPAPAPQLPMPPPPTLTLCCFAAWQSQSAEVQNSALRFSFGRVERCRKVAMFCAQGKG